MGAGPDFRLRARLIHEVHPRLRLRADFEVGRERAVLFGPSGAGKTTLLRLIAGLVRPQEGEIALGEDVLCDSARKVHRPLRSRRIGMIFQDDLLFPHLSVAANIGFGLRGLGRDEARRRVGEVAALCGVSGLLDRAPASLSGGERQRVGLARTLAPRPRLLLCDEPVSALDLDARHDLISRLKGVQEAEGIPLLFVTHQPAEAVELGTRLLRVVDGVVSDEGEPLPALARTADRGGGLFGLANVLDGVVVGHAPDEGNTLVRLGDAIVLLVPHRDLAPQTPVSVRIPAADILLADGPLPAMSARNRLAGTVDRVIMHGHEAEVVVRTDGIAWIASVTAPSVAALCLAPGRPIGMIIKARNCEVRAR